MPVVYKNKKFSAHFQLVIRHTYKPASSHRNEVNYYQYFLTCRTTKMPSINSFPINDFFNCLIEATFVSGVCNEAMEKTKKKLNDGPIQDVIREAQKKFRDG